VEAIGLAGADGARVPALRGVFALPWWVRFLRDPIHCLTALRARHGPLFALHNPVPGGGHGSRFAFALSPEYNRVVLSDPDRFRATGQTLPGPAGSSQRRVRYGLTRTRGERHREQRALLMPLFQRPAIREKAGAMAEVIERVLGDWAPGSTIDARLEMRRLMLRLSSEVLFGREDTARSWRLGELIGDWLSRNFQGRVWLALFDLPGTPYRALLRSAARIEGEIRAMVADRLAAGAAGDDVISTLLRARDARPDWMRDQDLIGQATMLFAASYETTANAMTWTLLLLAQHPRVAEDLAAELHAALRGGPASLDALEALPFLDAVLRESMRILPPVPYAIRLVRGAGPLGALPLRDRDRVIVSHYVTHHLPELYADPERFDPARWFGLRRGPYEYLPFGAGPRTCIGISFANAAMKLALAAIAPRFRLWLPPGTRVDRSVAVTLSPRGPVPMRLFAPGCSPPPARLAGNVREMVRLPA
jgi:cytochrome P450